ncbi:MAG: hypothetical protein ACRBCK_06960 [Alphaproteobacteria bacterium]
MSDNQTVKTDVDMSDAFADTEAKRQLNGRVDEIFEDPAVQELASFLQESKGYSDEQTTTYIKGLYMGGSERVSLEDAGLDSDEAALSSADIS